MGSGRVIFVITGPTFRCYIRNSSSEINQITIDLQATTEVNYCIHLRYSRF